MYGKTDNENDSKNNTNNINKSLYQNENNKTIEDCNGGREIFNHKFVCGHD